MALGKSFAVLLLYERLIVEFVRLGLFIKLASFRQKRLVRAPGLEPGTNGLKVRCSSCHALQSVAALPLIPGLTDN